MIQENLLTIETAAIRYCSEYDEAAFFEWLAKIKGVEGFDGSDRKFTWSIETADFDEDAFRELIALFYRYRIDMKQLVKLRRPDFDIWLRNEHAFWYDLMFL